MIKYIMKNKKYLLISVLFYFLSSVFNILVSYSMGFFYKCIIKKRIKYCYYLGFNNIIINSYFKFFSGDYNIF